MTVENVCVAIVGSILGILAGVLLTNLIIVVWKAACRLVGKLVNNTYKVVFIRLRYDGHLNKLIQVDGGNCVEYVHSRNKLTALVKFMVDNQNTIDRISVQFICEV